jgi:hypothetical protein
MDSVPSANREWAKGSVLDSFRSVSGLRLLLVGGSALRRARSDEEERGSLSWAELRRTTVEAERLVSEINAKAVASRPAGRLTHESSRFQREVENRSADVAGQLQAALTILDRAIQE